MEGPPFANIWLDAYSPDSKHLLYTRQPSKQSGTELVEDGSKIADAPGIDFPVFSPDSSRIAYATYKGAANKLTWAMAVDGQAGAEYRMTELPTFSADSKHFAYLAQTAPSPAMHTVNTTDREEAGQWSWISKLGASTALLFRGR